MLSEPSGIGYSSSMVAMKSYFSRSGYAANSNGNARNWKSLCEELKAVRKTTIILFDSFDEATLMNTGIANNKNATVLAMGFTAVGHVYHHKKIIEARYL